MKPLAFTKHPIIRRIVSFSAGVGVGLGIGLVVAAFAASLSISDLPDGYQDGRADAPDAVYNSFVSAGARAYQARLIEIERKTFGLAQLFSQVGPSSTLAERNENSMKQAEYIYLLEHEIIRLQQDLSDAKGAELTDFERNSLQLQTIETYRKVRTFAERIFEDMVRFIDVAKPGPNGKQIREEISCGLSAYTCNYRTDETLTEEEQLKKYQIKLAEFLAKGGKLEEMFLLNRQSFLGLSRYTRVEYVELMNGEVWATTGNAGHILLAKGQKVKNAGQIVIIKDGLGRATMLIVTNASGSYKPDMYSTHQLAFRLSTELKVPYGHTIITKGEPITTAPLKVYGKGMDIADDVTKARIKNLEASAKEIYARPLAPQVLAARCASLFNLSPIAAN